MKRVLVGLWLLSMTGCAGSLVDAQRDGIAARLNRHPEKIGYAASDRCNALDDEHRKWAGYTLGGVVLTGATGLSTLPAEELPEKTQGPVRYTTAGVIVLVAAATAVVHGWELSAAESFERECTP